MSWTNILNQILEEYQNIPCSFNNTSCYVFKPKGAEVYESRKKSETNLTNCQNCSVCVEVFLQSYYVLVRLLKKTTSKKVKSWKEVKCCDKDWTRFNARVHLTIGQEFFFLSSFAAIATAIWLVSTGIRICGCLQI